MVRPPRRTRASSFSRWMAALVLVTWLAYEVRGQDPGDFFLQELMDKYGSGTRMNTSQLTGLMTAVHNMMTDASHGKGEDTKQEATSLQTKHGPSNNCSNLTSTDCLKSKCLDSAAIFNIHALPVDYSANASQVALLSPTLLYQLQNAECYRNEKEPSQSGKKSKPTPGETWGFGMLAVTIINVCAGFGIVFYPIMRTQVYKKILMTMVGLAVGSLSASAILVLIPEALELMGEESHLRDVYVWRMVVVLGGVYIFFTVERILEALVSRRQKHAEKKTMKSKGVNNPAFEMEVEVVANGNASNHDDHGHSHNVEPPRRPMRWAPMSEIKPVAWMIVFGDALHNFVDGVSIGAAFSADLLAGVSLSLAVVCEELPHELGDFAVLLSSGMGLCQAMLVNVGSGLTCYLGLVVGIQVGNLENGAIYIFALAAGMFLYISFVDMLPEMNAQAREAEKEKGSVCLVYLLQNIGLLAGWCIILLLVVYSDKISFG